MKYADFYKTVRKGVLKAKSNATIVLHCSVRHHIFDLFSKANILASYLPQLWPRECFHFCFDVPLEPKNVPIVANIVRLGPAEGAEDRAVVVKIATGHFVNANHAMISLEYILVILRCIIVSCRISKVKMRLTRVPAIQLSSRYSLPHIWDDISVCLPWFLRQTHPKRRRSQRWRIWRRVRKSWRCHKLQCALSTKRDDFRSVGLWKEKYWYAACSLKYILNDIQSRSLSFWGPRQ